MAAPLSRHSHFLAHSSNVNCLRFGRKSGQVAATGGDDAMVNLWRMREKETKNIMSLSGHQSAVESIVFDPAEKKVVAGSKSGSIKAFDLEAAKVSRTLKGHMSTCTALDYHLYGDYVASGSLDTIVKVWDLRTKSVMQTFKGHATDVTALCFTPDGRWLTSGSADGSIKIWDLTSGKMLHEFADHGGAITSLEFNPEEFILVSSSSDRTIRIWDVQEFALSGVSPVDNATTTTMCHTLTEPYTGKYLLCCSQEAIRIWSYETAIECHDSIANTGSKELGAADTPVDTTMLQDMKMMGGSIQDAFVSIWILDLAQVKPFARPTSSAPSRASGRPVSARGPASSDSAPPRNAPGAPVSSSNRNNPPAPASTSGRDVSSADTGGNVDKLPPDFSKRVVVSSRPETPGVGIGTSAPAVVSRPPTQQNVPNDRPASQQSALGPSTSRVTTQQNVPMPFSRPSTQNTPRFDNGSSGSDGRYSRPPSARPPTGAAGAADAGYPDDFSRQNEAADSTAATEAPPEPIVTSDYITELRCGMDTCIKSFRFRQKCVQQLLVHWEKGNMHDGFRYLSQLPSGKREAVVVDVLRATDLQSLGVDLEACLLLLPLISELFLSRFETYLDVGVESGQKLFHAFSPIVKDMRDAPGFRGRIDLASEQRQQRCSSCDAYFQEIHQRVRQLEAANSYPSLDGKVRAFARALDGFYR